MNDNQSAMKKVFEGIYNFVAPVPEGSEPQKSFYTQLKAGIDVSNFTEKESAIMANRIPAVQRDYSAQGNVSDVYQKILGAVLPEDEPPKEKKSKYEQAKKLVSRDSQKYTDYKEARKVYNAAYIKYCRLKNDNMSDAVDVKEAKMALDDAMEDFIAAGKTEIEEALAVIASYERYTPQAIFNEAGKNFDEAKTESKTEGFYAVNFIPNDWTDSEKLAWESVELQTSEQKIRLDNETKKTIFSEQTDYSAGWWFWKYEEKATAEEKRIITSSNSQMTTNDLSLSMELAVVELDRPWFDRTLLSYSEAYLRNEPSGVICSGTLLGEGEMQLIPNAFVLVRNVNIYNQFSNEEKSMMKAVIDGKSDDLYYGPFCVRRSSHAELHDEISKEEQKKYGNVSCLNLGEQPQLIGVLSSIATPKFPAISGKEIK